MFMSLLCWRPQNWMQYSRCGLQDVFRAVCCAGFLAFFYCLGIIRLQDFCCRKADANPFGGKSNSLFKLKAKSSGRTNPAAKRGASMGKALFEVQCDICTRTGWCKLALSNFTWRISGRFSLSRGLKSTRGAGRMRFQRGLVQVGCESRKLAQQPGSPYPGLNSQCLREYLV